MTTTREEFEAWFSDGLSAPLRRNGEEYVFVAVQSAWDAWQAAHLAGQRAMQERAAKLCDGLHRRWRFGDYDTYSGPSECAAGVRELEVKP